MNVWEKNIPPENRFRVSARAELVGEPQTPESKAGTVAPTIRRPGRRSGSQPPLAPIDEQAMADGLRVGSAQALEHIVAAYRPRIYAVALSYTHNHHDAEDVVQETFIRAYRAGPLFRADCSLLTWLHSIALNLARNRYWYWRRRKRHQTVSLDTSTLPGADAEPSEFLASDDRTAVDESEAGDFAEQIEKGMTLLSERDRRILQLRVRQHAAYDEIGRVLGIGMGTVKSRLARARERLRAIICAHLGAECALTRKAS